MHLGLIDYGWSDYGLWFVMVLDYKLDIIQHDEQARKKPRSSTTVAAYGKNHHTRLQTMLDYSKFEKVVSTPEHLSHTCQEEINELCHTKLVHYLFSRRRQTMLENLVNTKVKKFSLEFKCDDFSNLFCFR